MNLLNKKKIRIMAMVGILLFIAGVLKLELGDNEWVNAAGSLLVFAIYIGMLTAWSLSVFRRMMNSHIRGCLLSISLLMLFWIFVRTLKGRPFEFIDQVGRILWYCYYIPMILIPLLSFFASLCLGMPEFWRPKRRFYLLFIPATVLIFSILTNDFHQLAFSFSPGYENWSSQYTYHLFYYITAIWMIGFFLASVGVFFYKSYIPHTKRQIYLPFSVLGVGIIYAVLYYIDSSANRFGFIEMTAMYCLLAIGIFESFIQTGLLPSNTKYRTFFSASSLRAQIIDLEGKVCYKSKLSEPVLFEEFKKLKDVGIFYHDPNTELYALPIRGGYVTWSKDISQLNQLIEELRDVGIELQDGVNLLKAEIDVKTRQIRVDEQNRLYGLTLEQTMPQLKKIKSKLSSVTSSNKLKKQQILEEINMLAVYIKRRSSLVFVSEGMETITVDNLTRCFKESLVILEIGGIQCIFLMQTTGKITPKVAILFYDLFEEVIEAEFAFLRRVWITLGDNITGKLLTMKIDSDTEIGDFPDVHWREEEIIALGGQILCHWENNHVYHISLHFPKGGDN